MAFQSARTVQDPQEGQATYEMANLRPKTTGLPFIVFISQRDQARRGVRVKVSPSPRIRPDQMGVYALRPFAHVAGPRLTSREEDQLEEWIRKNERALIDYWTGDIEYTEDVLVCCNPLARARTPT